MQLRVCQMYANANLRLIGTFAFLNVCFIDKSAVEA